MYALIQSGKTDRNTEMAVPGMAVGWAKVLNTK